jgi:hypothetical protein
MNHEHAVKNQVAEQYRLEELSPSERDEFEDHFFDCPECAGEVRALASFEEHAREVFREQQPRGQDSFWAFLQPLAHPAHAGLAALLLLLAGVSIYQSFLVIPRLQTELDTASSPRSYRSYPLRTVTRGADDQSLVIPPGAREIGLWMDLPPESAFPRYRCSLIADSGNTLSFILPAPDSPGLPLHALIPVVRLEDGGYRLEVRGIGDDGRESGIIATYRFITRSDEGGRDGR